MEHNLDNPDGCLVQYKVEYFRTRDEAREFRHKNIPDDTRQIFSVSNAYLYRLPIELVKAINALADMTNIRVWFNIYLAFYSNGYIEVDLYRYSNEPARYMVYAYPVKVPYTEELDKFINS